MASTDKYDFKILNHISQTMKSFEESKPCIYDAYGECGNKTIKSHSVSKNCLKNISENGHVFTTHFNSYERAKGVYKYFNEIGINKASTFKGFCSKHDDSIYSLIDENNFSLNSKLAATLASRSFAYELWVKARATETLSTLDPRDMNLQPDRAHADLVGGFYIGYRDFYYSFIESMNSITYEKPKWKFVEIIVPESLPFSYSAPLNFDVFPQYNKKVPDPNKNHPSMCISVLPRKNGTSISFCWSGSLTIGFSKFFKRVLAAGSHLPEFMIQFGLEHIEAIFLRPSFFKEFYSKYDNHINELLIQNTTPTQYNTMKITDRPLMGCIPKIDYNKCKISSNSLSGKKLIKGLSNG